jgi:DNA-binding beta-propeller fold protein YncE
MRPLTLALTFTVTLGAFAVAAPGESPTHHYLYVASPGVRNLLEYGGHGVLVFDIDNGHTFVRRIPSQGVDPTGKPLNVKGICASAATGRMYVSTLTFLTCYDLANDAILWEREYAGGCDRMAISPDGRVLYVPSLEGPHWNVVDADSGKVIKRVVTNSSSHNTIASPDGKFVFLAGLKSPEVSVLDTATNEIVRKIGPFSAPVRPFTIDSSASRLFACVNGRLGFEVGDIGTGRVLAKVDAGSVAEQKPKRHGCPSHGVAMTPDESEVWVVDAVGRAVHVFDATVMPPRVKGQPIRLRDEPGWITFTIDGKYAYPSTGEVIEAASRRIVTQLRDETGREVQSEKLLEIDFGADGKPVAVGNQFGVGRRRLTAAASAK